MKGWSSFRRVAEGSASVTGGLGALAEAWRAADRVSALAAETPTAADGAFATADVVFVSADQGSCWKRKPLAAGPRCDCPARRGPAGRRLGASCRSALTGRSAAKLTRDLCRAPSPEVHPCASLVRRPVATARRPRRS